jgi:plasmid stabilization system protein ParE
VKRVYAADAVEDLRRLRAFIAERDPQAARRVALQLLERLEHLAEFPLLGKPVVQAPEPESVRDLVSGKYVIRYSVHQHTVVVLRIWHHAEEHP